MDLLRACYTTKMRFFKDSNLEIPVKWYFCDADAKIFPGYTRFASGNWASSRSGWFGPGEVLGAPRPFYNGVAPSNHCNDLVWGRFTGQHFDGPQRSFAEGCLTSDPGLNTTADGLTPECMPLPQKCLLTIIERRNPDVTQPWAQGDTITLRHDPNPLHVHPLTPLWQADFNYFWQGGLCGPCTFSFECFPGGQGLRGHVNSPQFPDLISDDQRTFYWFDFKPWFGCAPFPTAEEWTCVLTFHLTAPPGWPFPFFPVNFFPPFFWPAGMF